MAANDHDRWLALTRTAPLRAEVGDVDVAESQARELLSMSERYRSSWNYNNAVHKAHVALGLVSLQQGDRASAVRELLEAGRVEESAVLVSFGPNMLLARELVSVGERQAVLDYLSLCRRFWRLGRTRLRVWSKRIASGEAPDFGPNLLY